MVRFIVASALIAGSAMAAGMNAKEADRQLELAFAQKFNETNLAQVKGMPPVPGSSGKESTRVTGKRGNVEIVNPYLRKSQNKAITNQIKTLFKHKGSGFGVAGGYRFDALPDGRMVRIADEGLVNMITEAPKGTSIVNPFACEAGLSDDEVAGMYSLSKKTYSRYAQPGVGGNIQYFLTSNPLNGKGEQIVTIQNAINTRPPQEVRYDRSALEEATKLRMSRLTPEQKGVDVKTVTKHNRLQGNKQGTISTAAALSDNDGAQYCSALFGHLKPFELVMGGSRKSITCHGECLSLFKDGGKNDIKYALKQTETKFRGNCVANAEVKKTVEDM